MPFGDTARLNLKKMVEFGARLALVCLQLSFLTGQTTASILRPVPKVASLRSDLKDPSYRALEKVPPPEVTAKSFVKNFVEDGLSLLAESTGVALVDGSGSIGACPFGKGKTALSYLMDSAKESNPTIDTKYAEITFASSATVNFNFLQSYKAAMEIKKIPYPGGNTNTQAGLAEAMQLFENQPPPGPFCEGKENGDYKDPNNCHGFISCSNGIAYYRNCPANLTFNQETDSCGYGPCAQGGREVVLLVTDGQSNVQTHLTVPKADALKQIGVKIYVVAVGDDSMYLGEMERVASDPPKDFLFRVKDYRDFVEVIKLVIKDVAPVLYNIIKGEPNPPC